MLIASSLAIAGRADVSEAAVTPPPAKVPLKLEVYKNPNCGCCGLWVEYMRENGYEVVVKPPMDINEIKKFLRIEPLYQSCHTAIWNRGEYFFEGHIPVKVINNFLTETPDNAIGLAVPGMPLGSPGMELEDRFTPYDVFLIKNDGSSEVYASFQQLKDQH